MQEETGKSDSNEKQDESRSAITSPPAGNQPVNDPNPQTTEEHVNKPTDERAEISRADHWHLRIACIELLVLVITGYFFFGEYWEIRNQSILMESQITTEASQGRFSDENTKKQMELLQDQVDAIKVQMRQDQRPWIHVMWDAKVTASIDSPPTAILTAKNIGKSPARNVLGIFRIEVIKNGETIRFMNPAWNGRAVKEVVTHNLPATFFSAGLMFLNDPPTVITVTRTKKNKIWQEEFPLAQEEAKQITSADSFIVIHGVITYFDVFDVIHWTKFCAWGSGATGSHDFTSKACADYNEVDSNR
jgi:hypothetical protein